MAYHDRDYAKQPDEPPSYVKIPKLASVFWLMLILLIFSLIRADENFFFLSDISYDANIRQGKLFSVLFAPFSPNFGWGLIGFFLGFYFVARRIISTDGVKEFLSIYFISALVGLVLFWLIQSFSIRLEILFPAFISPAIWSLMAVTMVYAVRYPNEKVYLYFILPIKISLLMTGIVVISLLIMVSSHFYIAEPVAFLGALGFGFFVAKKNIRLTAYFYKVQRFFSKAKSPFVSGLNIKTMSEEEIKREIDRLLDKITEKGAPSLTSKEREFLMKSSKRHQ